jgi:hypothetical protein
MITPDALQRCTTVLAAVDELGYQAPARPGAAEAYRLAMGLRDLVHDGAVTHSAATSPDWYASRDRPHRCLVDHAPARDDLALPIPLR